MLKRIAIATLALSGILAFATPKKAEAHTSFGVYVGAPAPVYVNPYYAYGYPYPYSYPAYGPTYSLGFGWGGGWGGHHEFHGGHGFHGRR
ncbi:MAG TPA: hypothetical protein VKX45_19340 [Bryobacteraceae bacterium]|jgi:hypothetical protein|nr:hypothetical protein [Bryobacteraceae bacterium]